MKEDTINWNLAKEILTHEAFAALRFLFSSMGEIDDSAFRHKANEFLKAKPKADKKGQLNLI